MQPEAQDQIPKELITNDVMEQLDKDEKLLAVVRRHVFGIFILYLEAIVALIAAISLIYFLLPSFIDSGQGDVYAKVGVVAAIIVMLVALILVIATFVYYKSYLIITDRNITQVIQGGLFRRKVSQLDMVNVEDVSAVRQGFFATILDYGVLNVETAGTAENFNFNYCPKPNFYAKQILEARERFKTT